MRQIISISAKLFLSLPFVLIFFHLMYADDGPGAWTQNLNGSGPIWHNCLVINPSNQQIMYAGSNTQGMYKSTNGGLNWTQINSGLTNLGVQSLAISQSSPNIVICGTTNTGANPGVYKSTDAGGSWTLMNNGITQTPINIQSVAINPANPNIVYIAIWDGSTTLNAIDGLYKTIDGCATWTVANTGMGTNKNILCIAINPLNPNTVYCGSSFLQSPATGPTYVYKSYNSGGTWASFSTGLPSASTDQNPVRMLSINSTDTNRVLAGLFQNSTNGGAYLTIDGGTSWIRRSTGIPNVAAVNIRTVLIRPGSTTEFYAGVDNTATAGVYRTLDAGLTWVVFNGGSMTNLCIVRALVFRTVPDSTLFAGVSAIAPGVHEYTWIPVGVHDPGTTVPSEYSLNQNYPNPFNPATIISFGLPKESFVSLKVYDVSGREVQTLINENRRAGNYSYSFDASSTSGGLPSGVYFYKIIASGFSDTKKMILLK